jgi:hypothetical protein
MSKKVTVVNAVVGGVVMRDYYVGDNGELYSKKSGVFKRMTPCHGENTPYPKTHFSVDGKKINVMAHRVVAETLIPFPVPAGVTKKEWAATPKSVQRVVAQTYQVNHIDHNKLNYHPSNLEWVTSKENAGKFQDTRKRPYQL